MKAVYINLDRAPGRRASMEAQSARGELGLERIAAVDGREIPEPERVRLVGADAPLSRSELGCYMSHMLAWQAVAESGAAWGLVFEDDVHLAEDIAAVAGSTDWIPGDADLVRLSSNRLPVTLSVTPAARHSGRDIVRLRSATVDLGGYVISARHARAMLERPRQYQRPVDRLLLDPSDGAVLYQLFPGAVVQAKWADFAFLPEADAASQIQTEKLPHRRRGLGEKLRGEMRNLYAKVIFPAALPLTQRFRPASRRLRVAPVPFRA